MKADEILQKSLDHLKERGINYDNKEGERSIAKTVKAFNAITGLDLTPEQGALFMVTLKMVRSQQGEFKADSYEDGAAYFALAGEEASTDNNVPEKEYNKHGIFRQPMIKL
jgi:hypothetical protein